MEQPYYQEPESPAPFPVGKRELIFAVMMVISCLLTANFTVYGGFNFGFAIGVLLCMGLNLGYFLLSGCKPTAYSLSVLGLCAVIAVGFCRSDDGFVKFILFLFLFLGSNLSLSLLSGKNRFAPGKFSTLGDSFTAFFGMGIGQLSPAFRGLSHALRQSGKPGRGVGAVLLGICIVFPILLIVIPLLISADAAFAGLLALMPKFSIEELLSTLILGCGLFCLLFARGTGLIHSQPKAAAPKNSAKGLSPITVGTVLVAVCGVYLLYLFSQLAYLGGGFSGLLPEGFTLAQYARRGFFEMALLSAVNVGIIALFLAIVKKDGTAPLSIRLLCLFIGLVTLFMVASASAKMFLYIESYGLTRLRLLTQIIMLFLALCTAVVMIWLFVPKLPYMKVIVLTALIIGAAVIWMDVDSMVAGYNVDAYLSGRLATIDVAHLEQLGNGAVPHIARLTREAQDPAVVRAAKACLSFRETPSGDFRSWNWVTAAAQQFLSK